MTAINTNTASLNAQYNLSKVNKEMETSMEALSSGKRINSAADDAAGLSIATRMESQVRGLNQAMTNAADGQNMLATAEGAMDEVTNMLQRMRELSLQAASDTMNTQDRENLNNEIDQLKTEIDRVVDTTRYNDQVLLDGSQQGTTFQIGSKANESLSFNIANMSTSSLGTTTSAVTGTASVEASANGTAASENVVNMTFNGNGAYTFDIVLDGQTGTGAANEQLSISGDLDGYSAAGIAQDINDKIALTAASGYTGRDLSGILEASYSGNTVTINNKEGTSVDISSFTAQGSNTAVVNPVSNANVGSTTLESVTEIDTLANTGGEEAVASNATLQLEEGKKFSFEINNTRIDVDTTTDGLATAGKTLAEAIADIEDEITNAIELTSGTGNATVTAATQSGHMTIEMQDATGADIDLSAFSKQSVSQVPNSFLTVNLDVTGTTTSTIDHDHYLSDDGTDTGTALAIATTKTGRIQFGDQTLANEFTIDWADQDTANGTSYAEQTYTIDITQDFNSELDRIADQISLHGGVEITAVNNGGTLEINNQSTGSVTFGITDAISAEGSAAVAEGDAHIWTDLLASEAVSDDDDISDETGATELVNGSVYHVSNGTEAQASVMALTFDSDDRYTFDIGSTEISADVSNGSLTSVMNVVNSQSSTTGVTAEIDGGSLLLSKADGTAFTVDNFAAEANGKMTAANAAGQGGSALLENAGTSASIAVGATGAAVATTMELSFSGDDKFSFKISDGSSTATVRATSTVDGSDADADTADLLAEINLALDSANMSNITAAVSGNDDGSIVLTNQLGGKIDITNFTSDSSQTMTASPAVGQGAALILNDDTATGSAEALSSVNALTASSATSAIEAIDRALENINSQRSELGALSNRLDHTISNLGNVVVNTEASQSRIEDADFAATTAELTKSQIMSQAATAMLAQANASKQGVLSLLQG